MAVLVEGLHDEQMITASLGGVLESAGAGTYPLRGATALKSVVESRLLFDGTRAFVLLVVDNTNHELVGIWDSARTMSDTDPDRAKQLLLELPDSNTGERRWLREVGIAAIEQGRLNRLHVHAMTEPDVICYLPADIVLGVGRTWEDVKQRWAADAPNGKAPSNLKGWLRNAKLSVTDHDVEIAVEEWVRRLGKGLELPADFRALSEQIVTLGTQAG